MSDFVEEEVTYHYYQTSGAYEGAATYYKEQLKSLAQGDSNQLAISELVNLRLRSRHAFRNNGYIKAAHDRFLEGQGEVYVNWVNKKGKKHTLMQELWDEFYKSPSLDDYGDFATFQAVLWSEYFLSGDAHTRMVIKRSPGIRVPFKLQAIPTCLHAIGYSSYLMQNEPDKNILYGMEFKESKPVTYFYQPDAISLNDIKSPVNSLNVTPVPASEIVRLFKRNEPGQWLGIPELASILLPLYELDDLTDATIARQKVAQAVAWVISNSSPLSLTPTGTPLTLNGKDGEKKIVFKGVGGSTLYLNKGEQLTQVQSADIGPNLSVLMQHELFRIAAALGIPYHSLTGDLSGLNFSSIRAIALEFRTRVEFLHNFFMIPCVLQPITDQFYALAKLYFPAVGNAKATFQLPKFASTDPLKDTQNAVLSIQNGLGTLKSFLDQRHLEFEDILEDRALIEQLKLTNLLDPSGANMAQANNTESNTNSSSN